MRAILVIDEQIDFTRSFGSLYVPKGEKAAANTGRWIRDNHPDAVFCTLDWHRAGHISLKGGWIGEFPEEMPVPYIIRKEQVMKGKFKPNHITLDVNQKSYTIWPDHCLAATRGAALDPNFKGYLDDWEISTGKTAEFIYKGERKDHEEYSAFGNSTELSKDPWLLELSKYDEVYVAGVAKEYCVANCLKSMRDSGLFKEGQIIELEKCIAGFGN